MVPDLVVFLVCESNFVDPGELVVEGSVECEES